MARGGPYINLIPREGGNIFSGATYFGYTNGSWQSDNLGELRSRGLNKPDSVDYIYYANVVGRGADQTQQALVLRLVRQDNGNNNIVTNSFYPDGRPGIFDQRVTNRTARLTWQVSAEEQDHGLLDDTRQDDRPRSSSPASTSRQLENGRVPRQKNTVAVKWTSTVSNKLLFEAGCPRRANTLGAKYQPGSHEGARHARVVRHRLADRHQSWHDDRVARRPARCGSTTHRICSPRPLSYVAGPHTFKSGVQWGFGELGRERSRPPTPISPNAIETVSRTRCMVYNTPSLAANRLNADLGFYVQDSWQVTNRLTVDPGCAFRVSQRLDGGRGPPQRAASCRPASSPPIPDLPNWFNVSPRFGVAYDLTGDAKTALKGTVNRYYRNFTGGHREPVRSAGAAERHPQLVRLRLRPGHVQLLGRWRCRPTATTSPRTTRSVRATTARFGTAPDRHFDPDSKRPYDMEYTLGVEREVAAWRVGGRHVVSAADSTTSSRRSTGWSSASDYTVVSSAQSAGTAS